MTQHIHAYERRVMREEEGFRLYLKARLGPESAHPLQVFRDKHPELWDVVQTFLLSAFRSGVALGTDITADNEV